MIFLSNIGVTALSSASAFALIRHSESNRPHGRTGEPPASRDPEAV
jgi:hypothetical protein